MTREAKRVKQFLMKLTVEEYKLIEAESKRRQLNKSELVRMIFQQWFFDRHKKD